MEKRSFRILGLLLVLTTISESGVIKEHPSGDGEIPLAINKFGDKKLGLHPGIGGSEEEDEFGIYEFDMGANDPQVPPDYDYGKPEEGGSIPGPDKDEPGIIKPEKIPPIDEDDDLDKKSDEDAYEPFDGEEDAYEPFDGEEDVLKSFGEDKDSKADKDESHHDKDDEDKKVPDEEDGGDKTILGEDEDDNIIPEEDEGEEKIPEDDEGEEKIPEGEGEEKIPEGDEDKTEHVPDVDDDDDDEKPDEDDENIGGGEESAFFHGGIFDTPFFNPELVHKYFNQLERALGHVFKQTLDEAMLLNGTYANTTEEEVEIDGKKYIVKKSLIKGADNHSSIYVEALSSKPKTEHTEEIKDVDVTNVTHT